jgi:4-hydroxy-3-methylbut-2-enyl diphosphate reductase
MAKVEIDPSAGFCFGVEQVIGTAVSRLQSGEALYGLGAMVHNQAEIDRLERLGLRTITHEDISSMGSGKLLIRAHGEPPSTFRLAAQYGVEVIDGTCPIVTRLQKKIRKAYEGMDRTRDQLVIFGKPDHPETIGLLGQVEGDAVVISNLEEIGKIEPGKRIHLFSQTTMDPDQFHEVEQGIRELLEHTPGHASVESFRSECTICGQMKKRKPRLSGFAMKYELILFVSGKNSSNGKMLFQYCRTINPSTYWISVPEEIDPEWLKDKQSVGISGATSTSRSQLEKVMEQVKKILSA